MHAAGWFPAAAIILFGGCNLSPVNEPKTETICVQIDRQNSETIAEIADRTADDIEFGNFVFHQLKKTMDDKKFAETIREKAIEIRGDEIESKPEPGILDLLIENSEYFCLGLISLYCIILVIVKDWKNGKNHNQARHPASPGHEKRPNRSVGGRKKPSPRGKTVAETGEEK